MVAWNAFVGFLAVVLSMLTTAYSGNLGFAIITLSLITRLALLPLTLRMARHAQAQQRILQTIKREIDELKAKYKSSPQKLGTELSKLYQKHGVKPIDGVNSLGLIVQLLLDQCCPALGQDKCLSKSFAPLGLWNSSFLPRACPRALFCRRPRLAQGRLSRLSPKRESRKSDKCVRPTRAFAGGQVRATLSSSAFFRMGFNQFFGQDYEAEDLGPF